jgi:hypothetical protein
MEFPPKLRRGACGIEGDRHVTLRTQLLTSRLICKLFNQYMRLACRLDLQGPERICMGKSCRVQNFSSLKILKLLPLRSIRYAYCKGLCPMTCKNTRFLRRHSCR